MSLLINSMQTSMSSFLLVGLGGGIGAMSRFGVSILANQFTMIPVIGTLISNTLGCLIMGAIFQLLYVMAIDSSNELLVEQNRLFFAVGFCGSFTTLSAVILDAKQLFDINQYIQSFMYLFGTMFSSIIFFFFGVFLINYFIQNQ
ncbi:MAG: CrcB family protein [Woeseiaceae bacterium]|nr:CrcB family protein [Woeseiaceae bacterium]MDG1713267.1 CrcB family protein [Woeseiaceae bacterium]MDG1865118.1 CrcB family protein [Woeseiaceae bacterium]